MEYYHIFIVPCLYFENGTSVQKNGDLHFWCWVLGEGTVTICMFNMASLI